MSRHINFGDEEHLALLAIFHQFLGLFQRVELARHSCHVLGIVQHRENLALQAPCLVFGEVPMEHIDLVSGEHVDFAFQLVHGDVATAHILHESAQLEGWPVHDLAILDLATHGLLHGQLAQGLHGPVHARFGHGFDVDGLAGHGESVRFLLIELGSLNGRYHLHFDALGGLSVHLSSRFGHKGYPVGL